jgi:hypothetical protein
MNAEQLADYIINIKEKIDTIAPEEKPIIIEQGLYNLIKHHVNEWETYKIYTYWVGGVLNEGKNLKAFYKIYEPIEEAHYEHGKIKYDRNNRIS